MLPIRCPKMVSKIRKKSVKVFEWVRRIPVQVVVTTYVATPFMKERRCRKKKQNKENIYFFLCVQKVATRKRALFPATCADFLSFFCGKKRKKKKEREGEEGSGHAA